MPRPMTSNLIAELSKDGVGNSLAPVFLVEVETNGGWVRLWNGIGNITYDPPGTNTTRNPSAAGAVVGVIGSGGALPTYWSAPETGYLITESGDTLTTESGDRLMIWE